VRLEWRPAEQVNAVAFDTPIIGWRGARVNTLRLWSAQPIDPILLDKFNSGDHIGALQESSKAEAITQVLYPADSTAAGQELRLKQEFFFSSASLQDIVRRHLQQYGDLHSLPDKVAIQLNDTHPAIGIAELMRILTDVHAHKWEDAWTITKGVFGYTNHTLLPEALETWPVALLERMLPRHMQIIYAINAEVLAEARTRAGFSDGQIASVSLIDEGGARRVRMGQLAFVGSHSINGVSALHTELMKKTVFSDLNKLYPNRINNKTNGVTPRRWLLECNPGLTRLVTERIGPGFQDDLDQLTALDAHADDPGFQQQFKAVKRANKQQLADVIRERVNISVSPDAMFDVQVKRIHEYKRQLLNIIEAVAQYSSMRAHPETDWVPRVKIFAGKAAPSYWNAKLIIKLINDVAKVINNDPSVRGLLKVVFLPNYNVSLAEVIMPGRPFRADLDGRARSFRHRQHEVRAQRRADHRHSRWRQHRDARGGRAGKLHHFRPDGRRGCRPAGARRGAARDHRQFAGPQGSAGDDFNGGILPRRSQSLPRSHRRSLRPRLVHGGA